MRLRTSIAAVLVWALIGASPAHALTRLEIVERAQRWVDLQVPYSQASRFETYRQDCSGMASMSWRLPAPGPSTRSLAVYGTPIARDELQPGDMLLKYDYHAAIFYKWANSEHTWYWALEQSSSVGHAVERLTKYPYWSQEGFVAYRPNTLTEVNDYGPYIEQVAGADRYQTALAASKRAFPDGSADTAVLCSGANWPDALGGSALAGAVSGPVLLTGPTALPAGVAEELARLGTERVVVIGGASAVSTAVVDAVSGLPGIAEVARIGGADRYQTAALVAEETVRERTDASLPYDGVVYVATGGHFADALGAAAVAAHTGRPILLSKTSQLPTSTVEAIGAIAARTAYIVGGTNAMPVPVESQLLATQIDDVERIAGADRYETSLELARHGVDEGLQWSGLALATGSGFADALAGAVMQARLGSVLVLTPSTHLSIHTDAAVRENTAQIDTVAVLGGDSAVSPLARRQVRWILDEP